MSQVIHQVTGNAKSGSLSSIDDVNMLNTIHHSPSQFLDVKDSVHSLLFNFNKYLIKWDVPDVTVVLKLTTRKLEHSRCLKVRCLHVQPSLASSRMNRMLGLDSG